MAPGVPQSGSALGPSHLAVSDSPLENIRLYIALRLPLSQKGGPVSLSPWPFLIPTPGSFLWSASLWGKLFLMILLWGQPPGHELIGCLPYFGPQDFGPLLTVGPQLSAWQVSGWRPPLPLSLSQASHPTAHSIPPMSSPILEMVLPSLWIQSNGEAPWPSSTCYCFLEQENSPLCQGTCV